MRVSEQELIALIDRCGLESAEVPGCKEVTFTFLGRYLKRYYPNNRETLMEVAQRMEERGNRLVLGRGRGEDVLRLRLP